MNDAPVVETYEDGDALYADIPVELLQSAGNLMCYEVTKIDGGQRTVGSSIFGIIGRSKPQDYVYTPSEVKSYDALEERVKNLEEGGSGAVSDVQIDGASIVQDGVANIPQIKGNNIVGVTKVVDGSGLTYQSAGALAGSIAIRQPSQSDIDEHAGIRWQRQFQPITVGTLDYALKVGMCDGKTSAWTDTEKTGAWSRLSSIKTAMDDVAVAGAHYFLGEMTEVSVVLPDDALIGQEISATWYNGSTASTLSITGNMLDFNYTPEANTRSEINCLWDGRYWSVIGLSQEIPSEEVTSE